MDVFMDLRKKSCITSHSPRLLHDLARKRVTPDPFILQSEAAIDFDELTNSRYTDPRVYNGSGGCYLMANFTSREPLMKELKNPVAFPSKDICRSAS